MDDIIGDNFAIISGEDISCEISNEHKAFLTKIGAKILTLPEDTRKSPELDLHLAFQKAFIIRPDRYVFGLVNADNSIRDQLNKLQKHFS
jgi:hypothetical protein